jgi:hypothetical protein
VFANLHTPLSKICLVFIVFIIAQNHFITALIFLQALFSFAQLVLNLPRIYAFSIYKYQIYCYFTPLLNF